MRLNGKDKLILKSLHGSKFPGNTDLENITGIPESTVRYRIKLMEKAGIIKGYSAIVDPMALGLHTALVICESVPSNSLFFGTVGGSGCVSILFDEYGKLYSESIDLLKKEVSVKEILPVVSTNVHITTWCLKDMIR